MRSVTARDCARAVSQLSSSPLDTVSSLAQREVSPTTRITAGVSGVLCACLLACFVCIVVVNAVASSLFSWVRSAEFLIIMFKKLPFSLNFLL